MASGTASASPSGDVVANVDRHMIELGRRRRSRGPDLGVGMGEPLKRGRRNDHRVGPLSPEHLDPELSGPPPISIRGMIASRSQAAGLSLIVVSSPAPPAM